MRKQIPVKEIVHKHFNTFTHNYYNYLVRYYTDRWISVVYDFSAKEDSCYTHISSNGYSIILGGKFYHSIKDYTPNSSVAIEDMSDVYDEVVDVYKAVLLHEVAHVKYTDMQDFKEQMKILESKNQLGLAEIFASASNIVEDIFIEKMFGFNSVVIPPYFRTLNDLAFTPEGWDKFRSKPEWNDPLAGVFNSYLYIHKSSYVVPVFPEFYMKYQSFFTTVMNDFMATYNGMDRNRKILALCYEIIQFITGQIPSMNALKVRQGLSAIDLPDLPPPPALPQQGQGEQGEGQGQQQQQQQGQSQGQQQQQQQGTLTKEQAEKIVGEIIKSVTNHTDAKVLSRANKPGTVKHATKPQGGDESVNHKDPNMSGMDDYIRQMIADNKPVPTYKHFAVEFAEFITPRLEMQYERYYSALEKETEAISEDIMDMFRVTYEERYETWRFGTRQGKLYRPQYADTKVDIFKKRRDPSKKFEMACKLIVDVSGSMKGQKLRVAAESLHALAVALEEMGVPFSIDTFNYESNTDYTTTYKRMDQPLDEIKTHLTALWKGEFPTDAPYFGANRDEHNLLYLYHLFHTESQSNNKIMIVLSDGATRGSKLELKNLIKEIEDSGIAVFGIGLHSNEVLYSYTDAVVIRELDQLVEAMATIIDNKLLS